MLGGGFGVGCSFFWFNLMTSENSVAGGLGGDGFLLGAGRCRSQACCFAGYSRRSAGRCAGYRSTQALFPGSKRVNLYRIKRFLVSQHHRDPFRLPLKGCYERRYRSELPGSRVLDGLIAAAWGEHASASRIYSIAQQAFC